MVDYSDPFISGTLFTITFLTALIAGSYPAFFLSSLKVINVLKGKFSGIGGATIRKTLVVSQFSLSVILIVCAIGVHQQIEYMRNKNLGFDKENIFYLRVNESIQKEFNGFKSELLQNSSVRFVARGTYNPMAIFDGIVLGDNAWPGKTKEDEVFFKRLQCDYDLLPALGLEFVKGRNFSPDFPSDSTNYIVTEEAVRLMKLTGDPVGQYLKAPDPGQIVGVLKDFHSEGLQSAIQPVIVALQPEVARRIFIRYEPGKIEEVMELVQKTYKKYSPEFPMEYAFVDEAFGQQYENEIIIGKLANCFTIIAIFISCLGLFGLSSFTAERRSKEISVRKVLGATILQMVIMLCRDFVIVISIALLIGLPVAWWGMQKFLETFQYRTEIGLSIFFVTALAMLGVALATVSYQSVKAALINPAEMLKSE
ncbi:MAG: FtsX-like permease family protein [Bacteroidota bacterium]